METTLIVSDQCSACKVLLDSLKNQGVLSKYKVVNVASPEGQDIVAKLGLKAVPNCVVIRREGSEDMARPCTDEEMGKVIAEAGGKSRT